MKYSKRMMVGLVLSLLTLNGCMLKHVFSDDEGGMHGEMQHGMMMHPAEGDDDE